MIKPPLEPAVVNKAPVVLEKPPVMTLPPRRESPARAPEPPLLMAPPVTPRADDRKRRTAPFSVEPPTPVRNALVVRPSAVTGLLTNVSLSGKLGDALSTGSAQASMPSGQPAPQVTPGGPVTYDDRFTQISTNLFNAIAGCTIAVPCFFDFNETTLSAHSFDFVVTGLSSGNYGITVTSTPSTTAAAPNVAKACVGPVVLTATQTKIFNQSTGIVF